MTAHLPVVIDPHGMGPIIAAVRNACGYKPVPINPWLNSTALYHDIRRAILHYNVLRDMGRAGWDARRQHGRRLLKARTADAIVELLTDGYSGWWMKALADDDVARNPSAWWMKNLAATVTPDECAAWSSRAGSLSLSWPETIVARLGVAELHVRIRRLLAERFTKESDVKALLGPGWALEWLISPRPADLPEDESCCLATLFQRYFGLHMKVKISRTSTHVGEKRKNYFYGPYLRFVLAVLIANDISVAPATLHTILKRK